ncbi:MAG TPA: hypothetical protein VLM19_02100, partial [Nitrospiraceae bacterium]|nr:hypothetical protein [Nitrospiraceae bacterium]
EPVVRRELGIAQHQHRPHLAAQARLLARVLGPVAALHPDLRIGSAPPMQARIHAVGLAVDELPGGIQLMPGLPKKPAGERIGIDAGTGEIVGLR